MRDIDWGYIGRENRDNPYYPMVFMESQFGDPIYGSPLSSISAGEWGHLNFKGEIYRLKLVGVLEHFLFSHILGIMIPTVFHIFQRGGPTTNQL